MAGVVAHKVLPLLASRIAQAAVATNVLRSASTLVTRIQQHNHSSIPSTNDTEVQASSITPKRRRSQAPAAGPPPDISPSGQEFAIRPQPFLPLSPKPRIGDPPELLPFHEDAFNPHQRFWLRGEDGANLHLPPELATSFPVDSDGASSPTLPIPCWSVLFKESNLQQQQYELGALDGQHQPQWPREWLCQRQSKAFQPRALLVDAMGTLIETSEQEHKVYESVGQKYGVSLSAEEILRRYQTAYSKPWRGALRYEGEALPFWHHVISESTGCSNPSYTEELHGYYATNSAWRLSDPHAHEAFAAIRRAGIKVAVVSNFDSRLRSVLESLGCLNCFDAVAVSAEVRAEKPSPEIFHAACDMLNVRPDEVVHVGDSRKNDIGGAKAAGCGGALLWKSDVSSFADVAARLGVDVPRSHPLSRPFYHRASATRPHVSAHAPMIA
ncbi:hypothetical protein CLOM_g12838 [Closterium sp. NIES-68]|nr:hypothetical protein CLOM_g12387 [Closterium sp. NIES-68]GJP53682.1 hypothetical protein CLOM_g12838 [Closterium sp. NIES-68]GJP66937.1 hypothetical protein CLOP_g23805 [Closterium sp. NIES-67]GJP82842.1 hypothetical protein CLOP_g13069 [Closterium sp. NIES-67]